MFVQCSLALCLRCHRLCKQMLNAVFGCTFMWMDVVDSSLDDIFDDIYNIVVSMCIHHSVHRSTVLKRHEFYF